MKRKNNKIFKFLFIIIGILIVIYFSAQEINKTPAKPKIQDLELTQEKKIEKKIEKIDWNALIPDLKNIISNKFKDFNSDIEISIYKEIDLNNDNINEAIVEILSPTGASLSNYVIFKINNYNKPELIKIKNQEGDIKEEIFLKGIGGGGRYGFNFDFLPEKQAIYKESFYAYNSLDDFCKVDIYIYKPLSDYFEYDDKLSSKFTLDYCKKLCDYVNEELRDYFVNICK